MQMIARQLPLTFSASPFDSLGARPWLPSDGAKDFTAQVEARLDAEAEWNIEAGRSADEAWPYDIWLTSVLAKWRGRQASGDDSPKVDQYGEHVIRLRDGTRVTAVYRPKEYVHPGSVELWGEVSRTGYLHLWVDNLSLPTSDEQMLAWLIGLAETARAAAIAEWDASRQKRASKRRRKTRAEGVVR